jgi:hypothetical protein
MNPKTSLFARDPRSWSARGIALACAAAAALTVFGCNRSKNGGYPTISARNPDGGGVTVHGTYDHCPQVVFQVSPDHAAVGQKLSLTAFASDAENDPLTYSWTASAGAIDDATAAATTFRCTARGAISISLTVSDGLCPTTAEGQVLCASESEDAGASDGGAAGAGGAVGFGGSTGAGGAGGMTGSRGGSGPGGATGGSIGPGSGGSGVGGGASGGGGASSGGACVETKPPAPLVDSCMSCLATNENATTDGCCPIAATDPAGFALCQTASACIRDGACNMSSDSTSCFCGAHAATCDTTGQPNGPCVAQITAAAGRNVTTHATDSPSAAQVLARFGDPNYALGRAVNIQSVAGAFCPAECGYDP